MRLPLQQCLIGMRVTVQLEDTSPAAHLPVTAWILLGHLDLPGGKVKVSEEPEAAVTCLHAIQRIPSQGHVPHEAKLVVDLTVLRVHIGVEETARLAQGNSVTVIQQPKDAPLYNQGQPLQGRRRPVNPTHPLRTLVVPGDRARNPAALMPRSPALALPTQVEELLSHAVGTRVLGEPVLGRAIHAEPIIARVEGVLALVAGALRVAEAAPRQHAQTPVAGVERRVAREVLGARQEVLPDGRRQPVQIDVGVEVAVTLLQRQRRPEVEELGYLEVDVEREAFEGRHCAGWDEDLWSSWLVIC